MHFIWQPYMLWKGKNPGEALQGELVLDGGRGATSLYKEFIFYWGRVVLQRCVSFYCASQ